MKALLEQAASKFKMNLLPPVSDETIAAFEAEFGFKLAPGLRELYKLCGGHDQQYDAFILPFEAARKMVVGLRDYGIPQIRHYFPITDSESNPLCVCCDDILNGYIVHVYHDDVAYLKYRNIESFLANLISTAPMDWSHRTDFVGGLPEAMEWTRRTPEDTAAARKLIDEAKTLPDDEDVARSDNYRFAFTLFTENEISEIAAFTEYPDVYISMSARSRLSKFKPNPLAEQALQNHKNLLDQFLKEGTHYLRELDVLAKDAPDPVIEDDRGLKWLDIPIFYIEQMYSQRNHPANWLRFVDMVRKSIEGKKQKPKG